MRIEKVKLYLFNELSEEIQQKVIDEEKSELEKDLDIHNDCMEDSYGTKLLDTYGIEVENIYWDRYSAYKCGFAGTVEDTDKFLKEIGFSELSELIKKEDEYLDMRLINSISICFGYGNNMGFDEASCPSPIDEDILEDLKEEDDVVNLPHILRCERINELWGELLEYLEDEFIREINTLIYIWVNEDYDYYLEDSTIKENILANEYEYTGEGERW